MKKIIIIALITFTGLKNFAQVNGSTIQPDKHTQLLLKSKKQKTAAWLLLGGGATVATIGILSFPKGYDFIFVSSNPDTESKGNLAGAVFQIGGLCMAGSIPLFIAAKRNMLKARLSMTSQQTALGLPPFVPKEISSITLSIPLGK